MARGGRGCCAEGAEDFKTEGKKLGNKTATPQLKLECKVEVWQIRKKNKHTNKIEYSY